MRVVKIFIVLLSLIFNLVLVYAEPFDFPKQWPFELSASGGYILKGIDIYIDGSESMKGFILDGKDSIYSKVLRSISTTFFNLAPLNSYKFGQRIIPLGSGDLWSRANQKEFYGEPETYLSDIILTAISKPRDRMSLIVTDGVQSKDKEGYNLSRVVDAIAKGIGGGWYVEIIGIKSEFNGMVYSEYKPGIKFYYKGERPFYIYVIANSSEALESCNKTLKSGLLGNLNLMIFNPTKGLVDNFSVEYNIAGSEYVTIITGSRVERKQKPAGTPEVMANRFEEPLSIWEDVWEDTPYPITLLWYNRVLDKSSVNFSNNLILIPPIDFAPRISAKYYDVSKSKWISINERILYLYGKSYNKKYKKYQLDWRFKIPQKDGWYLFKIEFYPVLSEVPLPQWVINWSTDVDIEAKYADKTLFLADLVNLLINRIGLKQRIGEFYLGIYVGR